MIVQLHRLIVYTALTITHHWLQARPHLPPQEDPPPAEAAPEPGRQQPRQPSVRCRERRAECLSLLIVESTKHCKFKLFVCDI